MQPTFSYLNDVYFGAGTIQQLPEVLAQYGLRKPLFVTDSGLISAGIASRAIPEGASVFRDVETNPSERSASQALEQYRQDGCDGVVAVGGGSPIDLAKVVALMCEHDGPLVQYALAEGGPRSIGHTVPPVIAVPTTAGSGSEVGKAALVTVEDGRKLGFLSPKLLPVAAVCDPELTATMPPGLTAATGMDAISHCVEAIFSSRQNPVAEAAATEGLRRGTRAILSAFADGTDISARAEMMWCSLFGGLSFQKGLGAVHSLSHPLGRFENLRLHHGTLNGLFLPAVIRYNADANSVAKQKVAAVLGGLDPAKYFEDLLTRLSLPQSLSDLCVTEEELVSSAPLAAADHCTATNPRSLTESDALDLYRSCL